MKQYKGKRMDYSLQGYNHFVDISSDIVE